MRKLFFISLLLMPLFSQAATDKTVSAVQLNNQAVGEIEKELMPAAQDHLIQALGKSPENSTLHLNLGFTFEKANQPEKAQASYEQALKFAKDSDSRFDAYFNLGHLAQKAEKTDEALQYYQAALLENPDSKETKTNIELLMKQEENKQNKNKDQKDQDQKQNQQNQNKDQKQDQKGQQNKDQKDQQNKDGQQNKDQDQKDKNKDGQQKQDQNQKQYSHQQAPKPQFKSDQLTQSDVNKILGELKQQEQRIRAEYNRKEVKEKANDKDW